METTRKKRSLQGLIGQVEGALRDLVIDRPLTWWREARVKMQDLPKTNFDLACVFAEQEKWFDATLRFRIVLYLQPSYPQAWYHLGSCYFRLGRMAKAKSAFAQALKQKPGHTEAQFMLALIDPESLPVAARPQQMPQKLVVQFFTSIADTYDALEVGNQYHGGAVVYEQLKGLLKTPNLTVVDLGCGTGIAALPWRTQAQTITGVDYTPAMLARAAAAISANRPLFDRTLAADISALGDVLEAGAADLVLAVNSIQFVGALNGVMAGAARALKPGGIFAVTVEPFTGQTGGFGLQKETGRFGHSVAYVKHVATAAGFTPVSQAPVALYPNTRATVCIFSKGSI